MPAELGWGCGDDCSVRAFATRCQVELDRLDIFVNNAGVNNFQHWNLTPDGHEELLQVMVLSTGLLSVLLLPLLAKSATTYPAEGSKDLSPHITIVTSSCEPPAWAFF